MQVIHKSLFGKQTLSNYISYKRNSRFVGISSVVLFSLLAFTILFPVQIKTDSSYARDGMLGNPSTTSLNLTLTNDTLALDLAATSSAGTFAASSPANFTVSTDNVTGYTLSIKSKVTDPTDTTEVTNASRLVNTDDGTKYISSISSSLAPATFSNISNTQYNNQWGYLPSKLNSSNNTNYLPAPSYDTATILNTTACANGTSPCTNNTDSYSITLGARVDGTLTAGTYEHAFTIIAVGNPVNYSITYNANDGANGANTTNMPSPNPQTGNTSSTTIALSSNKPKRTGYSFKGWCTVQPTADPNYPEDQVCPGGAAISQPSGVFGVDQTTVNIATLYAIWWQPNLTKLNANHATMQDMSPMACYNSSINDTATLTDDRDGTVRSYTVAKLADGLCWMTTNLNLGADHGIDLTPNDTDITTNFTLPASSSNYSATSDATNINTPNNLNNHTIASHTVNGVTYTTSVASYYTYAAATADTSTYSKSGYVTTSICPKNWDLPTDSQYLNLGTKGSITSASIAFASPYFFTYGGYRNGTDTFNNETTAGYYWTSRSYYRNASSTMGYWAYVHGGGFSSGSNGYKWYGAMIRCVASNGTTTVNYNGNGTTEYPVTGTTATQENVEINSTMSRTNSFTRAGWIFNNWNTAPDGSGITIAGNAPLSNLNPTPGGNITLYAQWIPRYTITYVNNCYTFSTGCTTSTSANTQKQYINLINSPSNGTETGTLGAYNKFTQTGFKIKSWNTTATGDGTDYPVSSTYTVPNASSAGDNITLYAQWIPVYSLIYDGNGADNSATDGSMINIKHTNAVVGDWLDLLASNFSRNGYGFAGWSLTQTNTTSASDINLALSNGNLTIYGPNETINLDNTFSSYADSNNKITLYAVWIAPEAGVTMQTFNSASTTYSSMPNGSIIALEDNRDNDVYMIAKLADGNWWMGENLRLDDSATLTSSNTNNPLVDNGTVALKQTWWQNSSISITATTENHLSPSLHNKTTGNTYSNFTGWCQYSYNSETDTKCANQSMLNTWNKLHITNTATTGYTYDYNPSTTDNITSTTSQSSPSHANLGKSIYTYGTYYNWYSATAGNGIYSKTSGNVSGDICPTGWHLPYGGTGTSGTNIGGTSGGFSYLDTQLTNPDGSHGTGDTQSTYAASQRWRKFPNNFIFSGHWNATEAYSRGNYGHYWSSSAHDSAFVHSFSFGEKRVKFVAESGWKGVGFSVCCVSN